MRDIKIRKIKRAYGSTTVEILICLFGNIYREAGYYLNWDEDTQFLVADEVSINEGQVQKVVEKAIQVNLFDRHKFEKYQILTSKAIQERYLEATKKRIGSIIKPEFLVNGVDNLVNDDINPAEVEFTEKKPQFRDTITPKVKESKVNKSKEKESKSSKSDLDDFVMDDFQQIVDFYQQNFGSVSPSKVEQLRELLEDSTHELVLEALKSADNFNAKSPINYAKSILVQWSRNNVKTIADIDDLRVKQQHQKQVKSSGKIVKDQPQWANSDYQENTSADEKAKFAKLQENMRFD